MEWKVIQDFSIFQGTTEIRGSRDAIRQAFKEELIQDGETWMVMIKNRNLPCPSGTSHTYNKEVAEEITLNIVNDFHPLFVEFKSKMQAIAIKE